MAIPVTPPSITLLGKIMNLIEEAAIKAPKIIQGIVLKYDFLLRAIFAIKNFGLIKKKINELNNLLLEKNAGDETRTRNFRRDRPVL
ncbi:MAG: hypothetical protein S4CHLAM6_04540 [Chlamydiae bacterium]|nr:hypothetical protein [Chlamydiota bacterium]